MEVCRLVGLLASDARVKSLQPMTCRACCTAITVFRHVQQQGVKHGRT